MCRWKRLALIGPPDTGLGEFTAGIMGIRRRKKRRKARDYTLEISGSQGGDILFTLGGRVSLDNARHLDEEVNAALFQKQPAALTVDLARVEYLDSTGGLILVELMTRARQQGVTCRLAQVPAKVQGILELIDADSLTRPSLRPGTLPHGLLDQIGTGFISFGRDLFELLSFLGELLFALGRAFLRPWEVRWSDVLVTMRRGGLEGLPILGLMSLLLGMVIAFMSSLQLKRLGATIFVASLVAVAMIKELGPLLTAILVSGRSGSAFAAEIGTMQVNEEVDALTVMGFESMGFLAVPKVLAAMVVVPVLSIYATFFGILGGVIVGVTLLDLTVYTFINETYSVMNLFDITSSLIKALVFGMIIAAIGCQRGFKVRGGAQEVGVQTTAAVVTSLFLIIVVDAAFAIVLHYIR